MKKSLKIRLNCLLIFNIFFSSLRWFVILVLFFAIFFFIIIINTIKCFTNIIYKNIRIIITQKQSNDNEITPVISSLVKAFFYVCRFIVAPYFSIT